VLMLILVYVNVIHTYTCTYNHIFIFVSLLIETPVDNRYTHTITHIFKSPKYGHENHVKHLKSKQVTNQTIYI